MVHEPQVKSTRNKFILYLDCFEVHLNGTLVQRRNVFGVAGVFVLAKLLSLGLVCQALRMPQLRVHLVQLQREVIVDVRLLEARWTVVHVHVATIEVDRRVVSIQLARLIKVGQRLHQVVAVVVREASVVVVNRRGTQLDGRRVVLDGAFHFAAFEER